MLCGPGENQQAFVRHSRGCVREDKITLAASGLLEAFKKMWPDAWGVRMEHVLRNALLTLRTEPTLSKGDRIRPRIWRTIEKPRTECPRICLHAIFVCGNLQ